MSQLFFSSLFQFTNTIPFFIYRLPDTGDLKYIYMRLAEYINFVPIDAEHLSSYSNESLGYVRVYVY